MFGRSVELSDSGDGLAKAEVRLRWDPSPWDQPPTHLDIVAGVYSVEAPFGPPAYVVHTESRSPDGTITMIRHSETGQGLGFDEAMVLELGRLAPSYVRVVVGVAIHQSGGPKTFADVHHAGVLVVEGYTELLADDFTRVSGSTAATVAEFRRNDSGTWDFREALRGFSSDPVAFTSQMGSAPPHR